MMKLFSKKIKIVRLNPVAVLPVYAHGPEEDAGMDLYSIEDVYLRTNEPYAVGTGLSIELPPGYEGQIRSRSGLALKTGLSVLNSPGTVDPGYRSELKVILNWNGFEKNLPWERFHPHEYHVRVGDRIAQLVIAQYQPVEWEESKALADSNRGVGGLGSSGR